ncbi:hypothetical protein [Phnomibacter ginsenosidimutans]|uniref:Uncharacterized protein n=1 Tax=Phnomibacter ginsenosidimutans TaxID=2676868 RepID=A0A6I6G7U9_9BACT|nr:hypothetical protein [Phnomibacter ginsenosidimutans]QGW28465.1 hypothetical protein GLV81_10465 [Phnomibacter ginsenosidimutans]QGW28467.1 hypothetical protein GLV81_10475 [Phnomibacter ginsenosidimutans]
MLEDNIEMFGITNPERQSVWWMANPTQHVSAHYFFKAAVICSGLQIPNSESLLLRFSACLYLPTYQHSNQPTHQHKKAEGGNLQLH